MTQEPPAIITYAEQDEHRTHIVARLTKEYGSDGARQVLPMIEELFALQHGEFESGEAWGKRLMLLGATIEIDIQRADVAMVTLPVTVPLKGEQLEALLAELGLRG